MASKGKKHSNMDHTSAAMASYLDKRREQNKKSAAKKSSAKKSSYSRGGHRC